MGKAVDTLERMVSLEIQPTMAQVQAVRTAIQFARKNYEADELISRLDDLESTIARELPQSRYP